MSTVKHYSDQINLNLDIKKKLNFKDSLRQAIFEIFQIWTKHARLQRIPSTFPYLKHLQAIDPSFLTITKLSSSEIRETFCEGVK